MRTTTITRARSRLVREYTIYLKDIYKVLKKKKDIKVNQEELAFIMHTMHDYIVDKMIEGQIFSMPYKLGKVYINIQKCEFGFSNGRILRNKTSYPLDPIKTKELGKFVWDTSFDEMLRIKYKPGIFKNNRLYSLKWIANLKMKLYNYAKYKLR